MKKNVLIYLAIVALGFTSCNNETDPVASFADEDRVLTQIDLTDPTVNDLYNDYNMGLLFKYDSNKDFAYTASSATQANIWGAVEIPQISTLYETTPPSNYSTLEEYQNAASLFLNDRVFKYFLKDTRIASLMPYKALVSYTINTNSSVSGDASQVLIESENRFTTSATKSALRTIYNENSIIFAVDFSNLTSSTNISKFSKDNFYILLCRIMGMHNLYDEIPAAFFGDRAEYYDTPMKDTFLVEYKLDDTATVQVIPKDWVYSKGFVDAQYFYGGSTGLRTIYQSKDYAGNTITRITHPKAFAPGYDFLSDKKTDVRSYLNEMIFRTSSEIQAFPSNIKDNMKILLDFYTNLGIDMLAVNPALSVLNS